MHGQHTFDGFQFKHHLISYDYVKAVSAVEPYGLVVDGQFHLSAKRQLAEREFVTETLLVSAFEQAGAESRMDLNRRTDDNTGQIPRNQFSPCLRDSVVDVCPHSA